MSSILIEKFYLNCAGVAIASQWQGCVQCWDLTPRFLWSLQRRAWRHLQVAVQRFENLPYNWWCTHIVSVWSSLSGNIDDLRLIRLLLLFLQVKLSDSLRREWLLTLNLLKLITLWVFRNLNRLIMFSKLCKSLSIPKRHK